MSAPSNMTFFLISGPRVGDSSACFALATSTTGSMGLWPLSNTLQLPKMPGYVVAVAATEVAAFPLDLQRSPWRRDRQGVVPPFPATV